MRELRLLERISACEQAEARSHATRSDVIVASIVDHLIRILNTRQGSVPCAPAFGVPDFTNLAGSLEAGSMEQLANALCRVVGRYEPRLKLPRVAFIPVDGPALSLRFSIDGHVSLAQQNVPVRLISQINPQGRVLLRFDSHAESSL